MAIYTLLPGQLQQIVYAASKSRNPPVTEYVISNLDQVNPIYYGAADSDAQQPDLTSDLTRDILDPLQSVTVRATLDWWALSTIATAPVQVDVIPEGLTLSTSPIDAAQAMISAGVPLEIAQQITQSGLSLVGNPVALFNTSAVSPSPPIGFGTNADTWPAQITAGVTGMTSAIGYVPPTAPGFVNGIPPAWPAIGSSGAGTFPVGVTVPVINFSPDIPSTLAGTNDARLATYLGGAPNGSWIMAYHECNLPQNGLTPTEVKQLDAYLLAKVHAINPTLKYGRGFATTAQTYMGGPAAFMSTGMDFYGMDGYQHSNTTATPNTIFDATLNEILGVAPTAQIAIIETGTALSVQSWFNAIANYAITNDLIAVQSFFGSQGGGSQAFQASFATALNAVSAQLAASGGSVPTIAAGATSVFTPLSPSPVAGYAPAAGISYDILVSLTAGASSTSPWCKFSLHWFNDDSASAQEVALQQWLLPMAANGAGTTRIQGIGPQRGRFLKAQAVNTDTVACTAQVKLNSTARNVARDDWRWDVNSSPNIPGYTRAPDGGGNVNQVAGVQSRAVPANGSVSYLAGLYAGQVWARFETDANSSVITVKMVPQPASVFNNTALFNEQITGVSASGPGDFFTELILPRAPCLITFSNSDSAAHNAFATIINED